MADPKYLELKRYTTDFSWCLALIPHFLCLSYPTSFFFFLLFLCNSSQYPYSENAWNKHFFHLKKKKKKKKKKKQERELWEKGYNISYCIVAFYYCKMCGGMVLPNPLHIMLQGD